MVEIAGWGGKATATGLTVSVTGWTLNRHGVALETTSADDNQYRTFLAGLKSWDGTINANFEVTNTLDVADRVQLALYLGSGTGLGISGSALITERGETSEVDGLISTIFTFQGSGAYSEDLS